jgi:hypothetical protein
MITRRGLVEGFDYRVYKKLYMEATKEVQNRISWLIWDANRKYEWGERS